MPLLAVLLLARSTDVTGGLLTLHQPHCDPFRRMFAHPAVLSRLKCETHIAIVVTIRSASRGGSSSDIFMHMMAGGCSGTLTSAAAGTR